MSQLVHSRFRDATSGRRLIALHGHDEFFESVREIGLAANPDGTVLGLQAAKGVYVVRTITGYTWFVGPLDQPSPVHYGDAMQDIERFLWDEIDRQPEGMAELPFLLGVEQGATMALAMAAATPDLISGVIAIDAIFPIVQGWEPPLAPLKGLPILLARNPEVSTQSAHVLTGDRIAETFSAWGGGVSQIDEAGGEIAEWLSKQPVRYLDRSTRPE